MADKTMPSVKLGDALSLFAQTGAKMDKASIDKYTQIYHQDPQHFKDVYESTAYAAGVYGPKNVPKLQPFMPQIQNQAKYYRQRVQTGYDPIEIRDPTWNPGQYDDDTNEALGAWYKQNNALPGADQQEQFQTQLRQYKLNKAEKNRQDTYALAGFSSPGSTELNFSQDWKKLGYDYDAADAGDVRRRQLGMPPKSFLGLYQGDEDDNIRLRTGQLPKAIDPIYTLQQKLDANAEAHGGAGYRDYSQNPTNTMKGNAQATGGPDIVGGVVQGVHDYLQQPVRNDLATTLKQQSQQPGATAQTTTQVSQATPKLTIPTVRKADGTKMNLGELAQYMHNGGKIAVDASSSPVSNYEKAKPQVLNSYEQVLTDAVKQKLDAEGPTQANDTMKKNLAAGYKITELDPYTGVPLDGYPDDPDTRESLLLEWSKSFQLNPIQFPQTSEALKYAYIAATPIPQDEQTTGIVMQGAAAKGNRLYGTRNLSSRETKNNPFVQGVRNLTPQQELAVDYYYGLGDNKTAETLLDMYGNEQAMAWEKPQIDQSVKTTNVPGKVGNALLREPYNAAQYAGQTLIHGVENIARGTNTPAPESEATLAIRKAQAGETSLSQGKSFLAQKGIEIALSTGKMLPYLAFGPGAPAAMGITAGGEGALAAKDSGATGLQQIMMGTAEGVVAGAAGKIEIGQLKAFKPLAAKDAEGLVINVATRKGVKAIGEATAAALVKNGVMKTTLKEAGKQIAVDALTQTGMDAANLLSDHVIMGMLGNGATRSQIEQYYDARVADGEGDPQAKWNAFWDIIGRFGNSAMVGAGMGMLLGAGKTAGRLMSLRRVAPAAHEMFVTLNEAKANASSLSPAEARAAGLDIGELRKQSDDLKVVESDPLLTADPTTGKADPNHDPYYTAVMHEWEVQSEKVKTTFGKDELTDEDIARAKSELGIDIPDLADKVAQATLFHAMTPAARFAALSAIGIAKDYYPPELVAEHARNFAPNLTEENLPALKAKELPPENVTVADGQQGRLPRGPGLPGNDPKRQHSSASDNTLPNAQKGRLPGIVLYALQTSGRLPEAKSAAQSAVQAALPSPAGIRSIGKGLSTGPKLSAAHNAGQRLAVVHADSPVNISHTSPEPIEIPQQLNTTARPHAPKQAAPRLGQPRQVAAIGAAQSHSQPDSLERFQTDARAEALRDAVLDMGQGVADGDGRGYTGIIKAPGKYSELQINEILNQLHGNGFKNDPLRQAYEKEVANLSTVKDNLLVEGLSPEEIAKKLNQARRDLGVKYKDATPQPLRDYIYELNQDRYGDPLGPTFEKLVKNGKTYEQIMESASRPNADINKLLSGFEKWLREQ